MAANLKQMFDRLKTSIEGPESGSLRKLLLEFYPVVSAIVMALILIDMLLD